MSEYIKKKYLIYFFLWTLSIVFFYFSINYSLEGSTLYIFFKKFTSPLNAYFFDQLFFLFFFLIFFTLGFAKKLLKINFIFFVVFFLILITILIFQNEVLQKYFIKEDYSFLLRNLNQAIIDPNLNIYSTFFFKYYPYVSFSLLFKLFALDAFYYNLASLILMALGASLLYNLLTFLVPTSKLAIKAFSLLIVLVYLISPITMEIYVWVQGGHANGFIISSLISSLYFYIKFIRSKNVLFFILSFLLVLFLLKTALVRSAIWPICLVFLDFIFLSKKKELLNFLFRAGLLLIPLSMVISMAIQPFLTNSLSNQTYSLLQRLYIFFSNIPPSIIPYQIYFPIYKFIISFLEANRINDGFIHNNIFFILGVLLFIFITIITLQLQRKSKKARIIIFFWFSSIAYLSFFTLFGNWGLPKDSFDKSFLNYAEVPSSRYYTFTFLFTVITLYLQYFALRKTTKTTYLVTIFLIIILISNINFTQSTQHDLNNVDTIPLKKVSENVLRMVPDINEPRILFAVDGAPKVVRFLGFDSFSALYKYPPVNIYTEEELISYLNSNNIKSNNFFAYRFNENSLIFEDKSPEMREKLKAYLF